ncbi:sensor histidine kinase [Streptomyces prunicolor]|uniref:sensor histidine kinase n=1 Tax=Streptomyces prunicolor TaxID=67348 RepID=UPI003F4D523B
MPRRPFGSITARAVIGTTAVVAAVLVVTQWAVLMVLQADLSHMADVKAAAVANAAAEKLAAGTDPTALTSEVTIQIVDAQGRNVGSPKLVKGTSQLPAGTLTTASSGSGVGVPGDLGTGTESASSTPTPALSPQPSPTGSASTGEDRLKVVGVTGYSMTGSARVSTTYHGKPVTVYAASSLTTERATVRTVRTAMLIGLPLLLAVVAAMTGLVTRRALRPVERIQREMAAITGNSDLSRRIPEPATRDAIGRLARTTNKTLAALEEAVSRQRQFVADASHELRNPIAALRAQLEVGAAHPQVLDVGEAVVDVVRLQQLAGDLLLLARLDAGEQPRVEARVSLPGLVRTHLAQRVVDAPGGGGGVPAVRMGSVAQAEVAGSSPQLERVLANLVDNALRHASSQVVVSVRAMDGEAVLEVSDDGDGVPEDQRERIFERFVRLDEARGRDDGGAGLGLAIVRDVVVRHGGSIAVREAACGGAVFEVRLPSI